MSGATDRWDASIADELRFWEQALSGQDDTARKLRERAIVRPLQQWVRDEIRSSGDVVRILDVGSGPLTTLGSEWSGRTVVIDAVDPLADAYGSLLDDLGISPPVRAVPGRGEALVGQFGENRYDFVLSANALDHCADPVKVIEEMAVVTKPDGVIVLNHLIDVADLEGHTGLHQWNLRPSGGDMVIEGDGRHVLLSALLPNASIDVLDRGSDFLVKIVKQRPATA